MMILILWVNYNDLTSRPNPWEALGSKGNHPKMAARFRLMNYCNLPRCIAKGLRKARLGGSLRYLLATTGGISCRCLGAMWCCQMFYETFVQQNFGPATPKSSEIPWFIIIFPLKTGYFGVIGLFSKGLPCQVEKDEAQRLQSSMQLAQGPQLSALDRGPWALSSYLSLARYLSLSIYLYKGK